MSIERLREVPDVPRWVEARAMLLRGCGRVHGDDDGWVVRNERPGGRLVVVVGTPAPQTIVSALDGRTDREILCPVEHEATTARALPGWTSERALLYRLVRPEALAPVDDRVRLLRPADTLAHLPDGLREEMELVRREHDVHVALAEGRAASFAFAHWQTERQFDLSIDTAPAWRRRGLARLAASALIRDQLEHGRRPVWGAMASNLASRRLAEGLGFERADEVTIFTFARVTAFARSGSIASRYHEQSPARRRASSACCQRRR